MEPAKRKNVYTITVSADGKSKFWNLIGHAFVNKDGSINVRLNALPLNGTLHIRDPQDKDTYKDEETPF